MIQLFLLLVGAIVGWWLYGLITGKFFVEVLPVILLCISTGYLIGRRNPKNSNKMEV